MMPVNALYKELLHIQEDEVNWHALDRPECWAEFLDNLD